MSKGRIFPGDGDPRHGTTNGYSNLWCRCQLCRDAWTAYCLARREKRKAMSIPEEAHGKYVTYTNWGCRCDRCRAANAAQARRRYGAAR